MTDWRDAVGFLVISAVVVVLYVALLTVAEHFKDDANSARAAAQGEELQP